MERLSLQWDPEIDTPATVVVIGGGPAGVEAALYARFLGYSVFLLDAIKVGDSLRCWGDHPMQGSWGQVTSSLGLAALEAQGVGDLPSADTKITCQQYVEQYLLPVARTDLLHDSVLIHSTVRSVSRVGCLPGDALSPSQRSELEFRILIDSKQRGEISHLADIILDCSGLDSLRTGLASGGGLAAGELAATASMSRGKLQLAGGTQADDSRANFVGKHSILWGGDAAACANAVELAALANEDPETKLTWMVPKRMAKSSSRLHVPEHAQALQTQAANLREQTHPRVVCLDAWGVDGLQFHDPEGWLVRLQTREDEILEIRGDRFINCSPAIPDWRFLHGLSVPANSMSEQDTDAPTSNSGLTTEPHYYVLGQKSCPSRFPTIGDCLEQIRRVFAWIGGRQDLNLYETVRRSNS